MPKKKRPSEKPAEQFERFAETARNLEVDGETAEGAFKRLSTGKQGGEVRERKIKAQ